MKLNVIKETLLARLVAPSKIGLMSGKRKPGVRNEQATETIPGAAKFPHSVSENHEVIPLHELVELPAKGSPSFNFNHISFGLTC